MESPRISLLKQSVKSPKANSGKNSPKNSPTKRKASNSPTKRKSTNVSAYTDSSPLSSNSTNMSFSSPSPNAKAKMLKIVKSMSPIPKFDDWKQRNLVIKQYKDQVQQEREDHDHQVGQLQDEVKEEKLKRQLHALRVKDRLEMEKEAKLQADLEERRQFQLFKQQREEELQNEVDKKREKIVSMKSSYQLSQQEELEKWIRWERGEDVEEPKPEPEDTGLKQSKFKKPKKERKMKRIRVEGSAEQMVQYITNELYLCLDKNDPNGEQISSLEVNGMDLTEFINTNKLLLERSTYIAPWELGSETQDGTLKPSLIETLEKCFTSTVFTSEKKIDFDIKDSRGFTPLGVAVAGGLSLTNCFLHDFEMKKGAKPLTVPGLSLIKNTLASLIRLSEHFGANKMTPEIRTGKKYCNLHDIFLRYILSPFPYNKEVKSNDCSVLRSECNKILETLDCSEVSKKDLAVVAFNQEDVFKALIASVGQNPKKYYESQGLSESVIKSISQEYSKHHLDTTFWGGSSILASADENLLKSILDLLEKKGLEYSPLKMNPVNGAYSFVWNTRVMEVKNLEYVIKIAEKSKEKIQLNLVDDFGLSFLQYAKIGKGMISLAKEKGLELDVGTYKPYNPKWVQQEQIIKKRENLLTWGHKIDNPSKYNIQYLKNVRESYLYKTIIEDLCQKEMLKREDNVKESEVLLAHMAREICLWNKIKDPKDKEEKNVEQKAEESREKIQIFLSFLEKTKSKVNLKLFYGEKDDAQKKNAQELPLALSTVIVDKDESNKNVLNSVTVLNYSEIAIAMHSSMEQKTNWRKTIEEARQNSTWTVQSNEEVPLPIASAINSSLDPKADLQKVRGQWIFNNNTEIQSVLPQERVVKTLENIDTIGAQVFSEIAACTIDCEGNLQKCLEFAKANNMKIDMLAESKGQTIVEKMMNPKNKAYHDILLNYAKENNLKVDLKHENRSGYSLVETFGTNQEALQTIYKISEEHPDNFLIDLKSKCELLVKMNQSDKALELLKDQTDPELVLLRGQILDKSNPGEARKVYQEVLDKDPQNGEARLAMGLSYANENNKEQALIQLNIPSKADGLLQLKIVLNKANILLEIEKVEDAREILIEELDVQTMNLKKRPKEQALKKNVDTYLKAMKKLKTSKIPELVQGPFTDFVNGITDPKIVDPQKQEEETKELEKKSEEERQTTLEMLQKLNVENRKKMDELKLKNAIHHSYVQTFHSTLLARFDAYKVLATNLVQSNKDSFKMKGYFRTLVDLGQNYAGEVPIVGGAIKTLAKVVSMFFEEKDKVNENNEIVGVVKTLLAYGASETSDCSILILKAALDIAEDKIANNLPFDVPKDASLISEISALIEKAKESVLGESHALFDEPEENCAYRDVIAVLLYMKQNFKDIRKKARESQTTVHDFAKDIANIMINKEYEKLKPSGAKRSSSCCNMF